VTALVSTVQSPRSRRAAIERRWPARHRLVERHTSEPCALASRANASSKGPTRPRTIRPKSGGRTPRRAFHPQVAQRASSSMPAVSMKRTGPTEKLHGLLDRVGRGPCDVGHQRDMLAHHRVQQTGLAHVAPAKIRRAAHALGLVSSSSLPFPLRRAQAAHGLGVVNSSNSCSLKTPSARTTSRIEQRRSLALCAMLDAASYPTRATRAVTRAVDACTCARQHLRRQSFLRRRSGAGSGGPRQQVQTIDRQ